MDFFRAAFRPVGATAGLMLMAALLGAGCGASSTPRAEESAAKVDSPAAPVATSETDPSPIVQVGTGVGERVPDFSLQLVGGNTETAKNLLSEGRPTFLMFFATW